MRAAKTALAEAQRLLGKGPEQQTAAHFAGGVLNDGQLQPLSLRPVAGNIVEILGIGADLLKQRPGALMWARSCLRWYLRRRFLHQAVLAPDAFQSAMADGQIELADQAASAESGQGFAQLDQLASAAGGVL